MVVVLLIVANVLVFFWELSLGPTELDAAIHALGFVPRRFFGWEQAGGATLDPIRFLPLLTANFLHGGWAHIIGNMWFLWIFGDNVEDAMGRFRFLLFYLLCGLAAALAQVLVTPFSRQPMVGASGAIAGVLGAYLLLYPRARVRCLWIFVVFVTFVNIPAWALLGFWFVSQFFVPLESGVAWMAHVGGFVAGLILVRLFVSPPLHARSAWTR